MYFDRATYRSCGAISKVNDGCARRFQVGSGGQKCAQQRVAGDGAIASRMRRNGLEYQREKPVGEASRQHTSLALHQNTL
jgi:hypothetical protein